MAKVRLNGGDSEKEDLTPIVRQDELDVSKRSLGQKFADAFICGSAQDIKSYILTDLIIGVKNSFMNIMEMVLFNNVRGSRYRHSSYSDNTSYRSFYASEYDTQRRGRVIDSSRRSEYRNLRDGQDVYSSRRSSTASLRDSERIDYRSIIVPDRYDAEDIVDRLRAKIERSDDAVATKYDLFEAVRDIAGINIPATHVDNNWGWLRTDDIGIKKVPGYGYLIDVAEAVYLD